MRHLTFSLAALLLVQGTTALAQDNANGDSEAGATENTSQSDFIGRYDGSGMETAMGMVIREDGTFAWGLSVGALDLQASGNWTEQDGTIALTSNPKPVPPEFRLLPSDERTENHLLRVQTPAGRQLSYVDIGVQCGEEMQTFIEIPEDGLVLDKQSCPEPTAVLLELPSTNMEPQLLDLVELGWVYGTPILFEFRRNDLGLVDFTGMTGHLEYGMLILRGGRFNMELRKMN